MSKFQELLTELEGEHAALAKSFPADDGEGEKKIAAAAADGGSQGDGDPDDDADKVDGDAGEAGDEPMTKSFKVTLADGSETDAVDATDLLKSLQEQVGSLTKQAAEVEPLAKALEQTLGLVKGQAGLIKSLTERVEKLSGEGRGRKAVVSVHEKPASETTLAKSEQGQGFSYADFLLKANAAFDAGKITGQELTSIDVYKRQGLAPRPELIEKVARATSA